MVFIIRDFILLVNNYCKIFLLDTNIYMIYALPMMKIEVLANKCEVHADTLYKAKRLGYMSKKLAKKLEKITGIKRLMWLYPDEYGNPWALLEDD
jgi:hypothetical protein